MSLSVYNKPYFDAQLKALPSNQQRILHPIHFGKVDLQNQKGTQPTYRLLHSKSNPQEWDLVQLSTSQTVAHVSQPSTSKTDVTFFNGKAGLAAIIQTAFGPKEIRMIALPGSQAALGDTKFNIEGERIQSNPDVPTYQQTASTPIQTVTKQAMILAGGFGTRFEPIAGEKATQLPKPGVVGIDGQDSVIVDIAKNLYNHGIRTIFITTHYRPVALQKQLNAFNQELEAEGKEKLTFNYIHETDALGSAGALLMELNKSHTRINLDQPLLIVQGDAITNADFSHLLNEHKQFQDQHNGLVSIATKQVPISAIKDFGFVVSDENGFVKTFVEKPGKMSKDEQKRPEIQQAIQDRQANTGIYIFSPKAFEAFKNLAPNQQTYDYAAEFLTPLVQNTRGTQHPNVMQATPLGEAYWADIGNPTQYYQSFKDALAGKLGPEKQQIAKQHAKDGVMYWQDTLPALLHMENPFQLSGNIIVANAPAKRQTGYSLTA